MNDPEKEAEELQCNQDTATHNSQDLEHPQSCPAYYRPTVAAALRKRDQAREDASAIGHERIVALESQLADANADIAQLKAQQNDLVPLLQEAVDNWHQNKVPSWGWGQIVSKRIAFASKAQFKEAGK